MQPASADKENADIDPAKLSLKERIRFFASKNKGAGASAVSASAQPAISAAVAAGAGAVAFIPSASSSEIFTVAPIADSNVGTIDAARPIFPAPALFSSAAPFTSAGAPMRAVTRAEAQPETSAATAAAAEIGPILTSAPATASTFAASTLEASTAVGSGAEVRASVVRATIAPKGARKIVTVRSGARSIGLRLNATIPGGLARVEAIDPDGVSAAAGVCVGDVLVKAPFDVREDLEKSFISWMEKADSWVLEFEASK